MILKNFSLNRLLVLLVALTFAFLLVDSLLEHRSLLTKESMVFVPIIFSLLGSMIAVIAVVLWKESWIRLLHFFLLSSFLVAAAGLYFHIKEEDDEDDAVTVESLEPKQEEKDKPPLAPLAFGGVALIGLLATSRKWHAEVIDK